MKRLILILALLIPCITHAGTVFTASVTGNINNAATFGGAGTPDCTGAAGDSIIGNNGVTVTDNINCILGSSPANNTGTPAVTCTTANTGTFIFSISAGISFAYRAPMIMCNAAWNIGAGATITHDSSLAVSPSTANYYWSTAQANDETNSVLIINGTSGNRVNWGIAAGSGNSGGFYCGGSVSCFRDGGQVQAQYVNFISCGTAALPCWYTWPNASGAKSTCSFCKFTSSSAIGLYSVSNTATNTVTYKLNNSTVLTPVASITAPSAGQAVVIFPSGNAAVPTGATYQLENDFIQGAMKFVGHTGANSVSNNFTCSNLILMGNVGGTVGTDAALTAGGFSPECASTDLVMYYDQANSSVSSDSFAGTSTRSMLMAQQNVTNLHILHLAYSPRVMNGLTYERQFDDPSADNASDAVQLSTSPYAQEAFTIEYGLWIPTPSGQAPGTVTNLASNSTCDNSSVFCPIVTVVHNTFQGDDAGGGQPASVGGEGSGNGYAGMYATVESNLEWRLSSGAGWVTKWCCNTFNANLFTTADYNGEYNTTGAVYYQNAGNTGYLNAPGTHDVVGNPTFVDKTRNFLKWGQSIAGGISNWTDIMIQLSKENDDSGYNAGYNLAAYYAWVRAGFVPTNAAFHNTAADGTDIGAIPFAGSTSGPTGIVWSGVKLNGVQ